jgi:hypothetical protein
MEVVFLDQYMALGFQKENTVFLPEEKNNFSVL